MNAVSEDFGRWLSAARQGSRDALGSLLEACRRYLLSVAHQEMNCDLQAKGGASDLVQETFLAGQQDFERFHGSSEEELRAWLRQLLYHRAAKFRRRYRATLKRRLASETALPEAELPGETHLPTPSVQVMADEQLQKVRQLMGSLPEDYRRVLALRYEEQRSFKEIGDLMERTPNAARLLWLRAVEFIKHELRCVP
jgi:RNA polymerase sigma-70 factor (ECF subfamily)